MMRIVTKYLTLLVVATILFAGFIYLEKNKSTLAWQLKAKKQLNPQTIALLKSLTGKKAIKIQVFTNPKSLLAKKIAAFFQPYKNINNEINIEFVDATSHPNLSKQYSITMQGEMVVTYQDEQLNHANITELSETAVDNAILQLLRRDDKWLVFAQGYGMRTIDDESASGLSDLLFFLKKTGIHVARMPLSPLLQLPENVKIIILPAPTQELDGQMVDWLQKQMSKGISLWWLADIDTVSQKHLELASNILLGDKVTISGNKYVAAINEFKPHKISENFKQPVLFAESREIVAADGDVIAKTEQNKTIMLAKQLPTARLLISGDVDFISNQYLKSAANKNFIIRS
ncbi:MAG TPA: hypothetical protein ENJ44_05750, partial [Oceanospirillales bacterium]|nr:hypothetical protein [Oceanospirillales bacterium]